MKKSILFFSLMIQLIAASAQSAAISLTNIAVSGNTVTFDVLLTPTGTIYLGNFDIFINFTGSQTVSGTPNEPMRTVRATLKSTDNSNVNISTAISANGTRINYQPTTPGNQTDFNEFIARITAPVSLGSYSVTFDSKPSGVISCGGTSVFTFSNVTPFGQTSVSSTCTGSKSLPLELLSFSATANSKSEKTNVLTSWLTASEVNVQGFDVERSATGKVFEKVGYVKSAGTPRGSYKFTDEVPMNGSNYYRLKMMNTDGSFAYSPVRSVTLSEGRTTGLSVSPNPAKEAVTVKLNATEAKTTTFELVDIAGKVLLTEKKKVEIGFNQLSLNLSSYSAGMYFLKVDGVAHRLVIGE